MQQSNKILKLIQTPLFIIKKQKNNKLFKLKICIFFKGFKVSVPLDYLLPNFQRIEYKIYNNFNANVYNKKTIVYENYRAFLLKFGILDRKFQGKLKYYFQYFIINIVFFNKMRTECINT